MNIRLKSNINSILAKTQLGLGDLFELYEDANTALGQFTNEIESVFGDAIIDALFSAQARLIKEAISTPSESYSDLAHKMAMWRREAPEIDGVDKLQRHDALAYSVFQDLIRLAELPVLMPKPDRLS